MLSTEMAALIVMILASLLIIVLMMSSVVTENLSMKKSSGKCMDYTTSYFLNARNFGTFYNFSPILVWVRFKCTPLSLNRFVNLLVLDLSGN